MKIIVNGRKVSDVSVLRGYDHIVVAVPTDKDYHSAQFQVFKSICVTPK